MPTPDLAATWGAIQRELRATVTDSTYHLWLEPLRLEAVDGPKLLVGAPDGMRTWVADRYARVLEACAETVTGVQSEIELVPFGSGAEPPTRHPAAPEAPAPAGEAGSGLGLNPKYTFEQFVIGDANRFAHAAALAVAELPGQAYNPLFIVGPPGVGKTHLLHSIGNYVRAYGGGLVVRYTTVERFTNEFLEALRARDVDAFKHRYRRNDVLLIDDIQFLESKVKTEEEFFHTFNALHDAGSQLVLTCDRLPRNLEALHDRLRERFEAGLVTDIQPPDIATRMTVLRKRAQHDGAGVSEAVLETIARRIDGNIRALEGALIRVVAYSSLSEQPMTAELASTVLDGFYGPQRRSGGAGRGAAPPSIEAIQDAVCQSFSISRDELLSSSRAARLVWPRQVAMYLARENTDLTFPDIARRFGGRNHTTVMHAVKRTAARPAADREAYDTVRELTESLSRSTGADLDRRD